MTKLSLLAALAASETGAVAPNKIEIYASCTEHTIGIGKNGSARLFIYDEDKEDLTKFANEELRKSFFRTFDHPVVGQVLVVRDRNDEGRPCVNISMQPPYDSGNGIGMFTMGLGFADDEKGWDRRDSIYLAFDDDQVDAYVTNAMKDILETSDFERYFPKGK